MQKVENNEIEQVTPNQLLQLAVQQDLDVDKLSKLMELQIRYEDRQAKKEYGLAMSKFRASCPEIYKTKKGHNSMYAPLDKIVKIIKDKESEYGFNHSWKTESQKEWVTVTCKVTHEGGHSEETPLGGPPDLTGSKNPIQAIKSTVSYLERITLCALFGVAPQDMDDDGNGASNNEKTAQQKLIETLINDAWMKYCENKRSLLSKDSEFDFVKFKEQLREQYGKLKPARKNYFEWTKVNIDKLVEGIDINKVIAKKEFNSDSKAKG